MFPLTNKLHNIFQEFSVFLTTLLTGSFFCILLQSPDSPKQNIWMLHFINFIPYRLFIYKITNRLFRRFHHILKLIDLIKRKRQSWQGNEHITCSTFKPRITGKNIMFVFLLVMKLVSGILQTVVKAITRGTISYFSLKCLFQSTGSHFRSSGREYDALPFLYIHLKITGNIKIFIEVIPTLLFFRVFNTPIPIRHEMKLTLFIQLHI